MHQPTDDILQHWQEQKCTTHTRYILCSTHATEQLISQRELLRTRTFPSRYSSSLGEEQKNKQKTKQKTERWSDEPMSVATVEAKCQTSVPSLQAWTADVKWGRGSWTTRHATDPLACPCLYRTHGCTAPVTYNSFVKSQIPGPKSRR